MKTVVSLLFALVLVLSLTCLIDLMSITLLAEAGLNIPLVMEGLLGLSCGSVLLIFVCSLLGDGIEPRWVVYLDAYGREDYRIHTRTGRRMEHARYGGHTHIRSTTGWHY